MVKDWEIIADNLHDAGWSLGGVSALDLESERSGLWTHIATTESDVQKESASVTHPLALPLI
jgi:transcription elongation GreA/GreB family factor